MIYNCTKIRHKGIHLSVYTARRQLSTSRPLYIKQVQQLPNHDLDQFRKLAFNARIPTRIPATSSSLPPACHKWFVDSGNSSELSKLEIDDLPSTLSLRPSFWTEYESTIVPLELTTPATATEPATFTRTSAPFKLLLTYLNTSQPSPPSPSIYLAQCDLPSLPKPLQDDLPTPSLIHAGKGDIYSSSLWLGHPPTYTPLHRDPNPNIFQQLAGRKLVRLFPPDVGDAIFEHVQDLLLRHQLQRPGAGAVSASFRGEEMMVGPEYEILHQIVWGDTNVDNKTEQVNTDADTMANLRAYAVEADLNLGDTLFIPKGWWHSVKGVGSGVTASANWWFR